MPRIDINKILKRGIQTKPRTIDYSDGERLEELRKLNIEVKERLNQSRMPITDFIINKGAMDKS